MQAHHQFETPLHFQYYDQPPSSHLPISDPFLSQDDGQNFTSGFSRGSSFTYPHQDYRYLLDRGELASRVCASSLMDGPFDATGLGFAGDPSSNGTFIPATEDISAYHQPWDQWIGATAPPPQAIVAPAPVYPSAAESSYFGIKDATANHNAPSSSSSSGVRSPPSQLPTPAAMAVLLNPHGRSEGELTQSGYDIPPGSAVLAHRASSSAAPIPPRTEEPIVTTQGVPESLSREKKHACTMCHKRFDRPSTLRKHLLVHTGEKAFVCDTCGRRFGVASNLNRHVKRCILKPVNTPSPNSQSGSPLAAATAESSGSSSLVSSLTSPTPSEDTSSATNARTGKRGRGRSTSNNASPSSSSSNPSMACPTSPNKASGQKRRRRAPSPSQWVPATLQNFNLVSEDSYRVTAVPLPPVRRNPPREERDSWDENVGHSPYHPCGWSGVLPGPGLGHGLGLGGKDVRNMNLGGRGGHMLGRVLVF
ncbi:hypothetical protein BDN70DRAFT_435995 [Pholiota conissans]|uniref:C2H2-type domain-containing protein n=1 Tax=Pholiota conissans TaxID=109636 RepID=A0A9P6CVZ9_9AGAR|nr:hypothetical protein BDN70DRAFT_435995 [Pholiota conissans]